VVPVITTERTSKRLKLHLVQSMFLMMFSGLGIFVFGDEGEIAGWALWMLGISAAWYWVTRIRVWWNHG
jgi:hypothetical protein